MKVYAQFGNDEDFVCREIDNVSVKSIIKAFKINLKKQKLSYQKIIGFVRITLRKKDVAMFNEDIKNLIKLHIKINEIPVPPKDSKTIWVNMAGGLFLVVIIMLSVPLKVIMGILLLLFCICILPVLIMIMGYLFIRFYINDKLQLMPAVGHTNNKKLLKK